MNTYYKSIEQKGFFFGGKLFYTNRNFYDLFLLTPGLGKSYKLGITKRLEVLNSPRINFTGIRDFGKLYKVEVTGFLNYYYSQVNSVNNTLFDLQKLNIVRLYLVKSYRGRCHAIGKPVNGQRTWSNAWTSYKYNYTLRKFIGETRSKLEKEKKPEKINFKMTKKKYVTKQKKVKKVTLKKLVWF